MHPLTHVKLRIVHLEDDPRDCELIAKRLAAEGLDCEIIQARTRSELEAALAGPNVELVLCDYTLPSCSGIQAFETTRNLRPELPFVFVSGTIGEERAVDSLRMGATDYVHKDNLDRLVPVVHRALRDAMNSRDRKRSEVRVYELNLLLQAIREIHRLIARERDPERLLAEACRALVHTRGYLLAWVARVVPNSSRVARTARAGKSTDYVETITVTWDEASSGQGPTGTAIRTGSPSTCQDITTDPRFEPWREDALACGFASAAAVPLMREARTWGAITVYSAKVDAFNAEELSLLHELAGDLAFALDAIDYERQRNHAIASMERSHAEMTTVYDALPLMICLLKLRAPGRAR